MLGKARTGRLVVVSPLFNNIVCSALIFINGVYCVVLLFVLCVRMFDLPKLFSFPSVDLLQLYCAGVLH